MCDEPPGDAPGRFGLGVVWGRPGFSGAERYAIEALLTGILLGGLREAYGAASQAVVP